MPLVDRTNEEIPLTIMGSSVIIDVDGDSSLHPAEWVTMYGIVDDEDWYINLTFEEAAQMRDRLNLILGE